jgi:hypothetical protein
MIERRRIVTADEQDAYTRWRRYMCRFNRAGKIRAIKVATHRRERREAQADIRAQLADR